MSYLVGIDIGGTFTDCAIVDRAGRLLTTKVPSTPPDFSRGMLDALGAGARARRVSLDAFCRDLAFLSHGTTVATNTISQKRGAKVGLITTKGHEDAIHIMRGSRGYGGRDIRKVVHFPETSKPAPIVPKRLIRGVSERVDCFGEIVVSLNETEAEAAIRSLLAEGVQAKPPCSRSTPARCPASPRRCSSAPRWARKTSSPPTWAAPRSTSRSSTTASRPTRSSATPTSTSTSCRKSTCRRSARAAAAWCASSQRRAP